jgi:hypothetical protein
LKKAQLEVLRNEIVSRIDAEKNQEALEETQVTPRARPEGPQSSRPHNLPVGMPLHGNSRALHDNVGEKDG